jgi:hypothetical protein
VTPRNEAERLVATALADALRGRLALGPLDIARLAVAAKQVPEERVASLALRHWVAVDPRARDVLRMTLLFAMEPRNAARAADKTAAR